MKLRRKLALITFTFAFILTSAYAANAAKGDDPAPTAPAPLSGYGAVRVDRDFGAFSMDDSNQFGDDQAYNQSNGRTNRESDYQGHHWLPESYGLTGNYGHYSGN